MEHFFRHESGRLVSQLARHFGLQYLDVIEDTVQSALLEALRTWRTAGVPDNPGGWIRQVARNRILDGLRHQRMAEQHAGTLARLTPDAVLPDLDDLTLDGEIADSQLRMMFACCHPALPEEDRVALTLRTLCGFHFAEIARALVISEDAAKKRLSRAKQLLVQAQVELDVPGPSEVEARLAAVQRVLYLLFNEGYLSTLGEQTIRQEVCEEAVRLTLILVDHPIAGTPSTHALCALMLLHAARLEARTDGDGRLLLLDEQDRTKWDRDLIALGRRCLDRSARGERITEYHLEAGIALEHCDAASVAETNWPQILRLYDLLVQANPSPVCRLNRAIAVSQVHGAQAGLDALADPLLQKELQHYHLLPATLGELQRRLGNVTAARQHFEAALTLTRSPADAEILQRKLTNVLAL